MTIDAKIRDESYNTILSRKQQKYQSYYQVKLINMNECKVTLPFDKTRMIELSNFTYSLLKKL